MSVSKNRMTRILFWFCLAGIGLPSLYAQTYNPPFPRTVFQSPYGTSGGAADYFYSLYDLAIHGLTKDDAKALNDSIRALNPNLLIFGTSRQGAWVDNEPAGMLVYHAVFLQLTAAVQPGDVQIAVKNLTEYDLPTRHNYALLGENDWISYTGHSATSLTGIPSSGPYAINSAHAIGDSIKFPCRMSGFGMLPNLTLLAPLVEGKETWRWFIDGRFERQDFSQFDGVFYDAFRTHLYLEDIETQAGVDLNYNRKNDFTEFGSSYTGLQWVNDQWEQGISATLDYERQRFSELHPDRYPVITLNSGAAEPGYELDICEGMLWEGFMRFGTDWQTTFNIGRAWEQKQKNAGRINFTMIIDYEPESRAAYGKNIFNRMRYGLTTCLMIGCFYGRTFGDYYYITYYHDEFDSNLGFPISDPVKLSNGAYVRFFDNGAAICNPTGTPITVTASQLRGTGVPGSERNLYRFEGGQDPLFNNGELFSSVDLKGETRERPKYNQGDGILLFNEEKTIVADIFIGNCFNNDTSPGNVPVELQGNWRQVMDTDDPFPTRNPCFSQWHQGEEGIGYAYANAGDGSAIATFRPNIGVSGYYEISEWHGFNSDSQSTDIPFEINAFGKAKLTGAIDQTRNAGRWNRLGIAYLTEGNENSVILSNNTNGTVIADAIRFRFLGKELQPDQTPPAPPQNVRVLQP